MHYINFKIFTISSSWSLMNLHLIIYILTYVRMYIFATFQSQSYS